MFRLFPVVVAILATLFAGCTAPGSGRVSRTVVLVSVDGLAASYLHDPKAEMPNLRRLAGMGAQAEGMIGACPSVTWPSHVTLVTGAYPAKHGVIGNAVLNTATGKIVTYIGDRELTKKQAVRCQTLYDAAHAAGLKTAAVIWPACNGAHTLDWMIPDANKREVHEQWTTPGFPAELAAAGIPIYELQGWGWDKKYSELRDDAYLQIVEHLIERHQPDLILLHLITPDGVQHAYGPQTPQAYEAVKNADARLGRLWESLQRPPLAGKATLFVTSDHGFAPYDKAIHLNAVLKRLGIVSDDGWKRPLEQRAIVRESGGTAFVYILDKLHRTPLSRQLREEFSKVEGVEAVLTPDEFTKLGVPVSDDNPEGPDLLVACGPGYVFQDKIDGAVVEQLAETRGSHGHMPDRPYMHSMFVAAGAGIRPGVKLELVCTIDVAPTIARLLGIELREADGDAIDEVLER